MLSCLPSSAWDSQSGRRGSAGSLRRRRGNPSRQASLPGTSVDIPTLGGFNALNLIDVGVLSTEACRNAPWWLYGELAGMFDGLSQTQMTGMVMQGHADLKELEV